MRFLEHLFLIGFLIAVIVVVQQSGHMNIHGIIPNAIFVVFAAMACKEKRWIAFLAPIAGIVVYAALFESFWILSFATIACIAVVMRMIRPFLTGNISADFFILLMSGIGMFYAARSLFFKTPFSLATMAEEMAYTIILGGVVWYMIIAYDKKIS